MRQGRIGEPCVLPARWGQVGPPRAGEYLKSPRGRIAYCILGVERVDPRRNARRYGYRLSVVRVATSDVPTDATVHPWFWDRREARR